MSTKRSARIDRTFLSKKVRLDVFGIGLHGWEQLMLLALAATGLIAITVAFTTTSVVILQRRETAAAKAELDQYKLDAGAKISAAETAGLIAQADIATATARIAEADARTKEAELKLEQIRKQVAARHIHMDRFLKILKDRPKQPVEIMFVKDDGEAFGLATEIRGALHQAKWEASEPMPIPPTETARLANLPSAMGAGGQPSGVSVVARAIGQDDFRVMDPDRESAFRSLSDALGDSIGHVAGGINFDASPEYGKLRVVVGPKINPN
jgi:hypothetical protein